MDKRKIIIDCDPGVDDSIALAYAAACQDNFDILAVTTVSGNQSIEKVTRNALDVTAFYNLDVPVARGMAEPLTRKTHYAAEFHGENGLGNCVIPRSSREAEKENAVFFMRKIIMDLPQDEKVTLICLAPLTNIALLFKMFPEVKEKIQEIIFMGGAAATGNVTPSAEFNIYVDPESAKIVFNCGLPLVMCGLDATEKCALNRHQILKLCQSPYKIAKFCGDMAGYCLENTCNKYRGVTSIHDVVPFMYLVHPEIFTPKSTILDVECSDGDTRGKTTCDFRWWQHEEGEMKDLVLMDADGSRFQEYLITALYELGDGLC